MLIGVRLEINFNGFYGLVDKDERMMDNFIL